MINSQGFPHRILNPFIRSDGTAPISITRKNHHDLHARRRNRFPGFFGPFRFRTGTLGAHIRWLSEAHHAVTKNSKGLTERILRLDASDVAALEAAIPIIERSSEER